MMPAPRLALPPLVLLSLAIGSAAQTQPTAATDDAPPPAPAADLPALERAYRTEPDDRKRNRLVQEMAGFSGAVELLGRIVETDPSDDVALTATYALRRAKLGEVVRGLERRLKTHPRDATARERLLRELERHQVFAAGQNLPHFLREAPPPFTVKVRDRARRTVRVLALGDFGDGSPRQQRVAAAIGRAHADNRFDLAVTLGDNFYPAGSAGPSDPRWDRDFESLYGKLDLLFFASLGNHDWVLADSPAAEILHAPPGGHWRLPAQRYTFVAGPAQFFAVDTNLLSRAQLEWLDRELGRSTARWKIVYGHHPIYSHGAHGDEPAVRDNLLPLLRGRAHLYLSGHEHDMQVLAPEKGLHFVIAGGGGAMPRPITPGARSLFAVSRNGFAVLDVGQNSLAVRLVGDDGRTLYKFAITQPAERRPAAATP
jgi:tartrate-resistant acid phosphatase type 5